MAKKATKSRQVMMPLSTTFIVSSLVVALVVNLLPWPRAIAPYVPDFIALTVLYWCIHQPRRFGFTAAWSAGLVVDVANGTLFGQHALAYSLLAYAGIVLHRRVLRFTMKDQMLHVIPLLLMTDLVVLAVRLLTGAQLPGLGYFGGSFIAGLLWPVVCLLLALPQKFKSRSEYA